MTKKNVILGVVILVLVDQVIKIVIAHYWMNIKIDFIPSVLGFRPIFNSEYSYVNASLKLERGIVFHTIYLVLMQLTIIFLYDYFRSMKIQTKLLDISFIFGQAAIICVFCGFFFWENGILDYIFLYPFTVDLKDIYLNCFAILILIYCYIYRKEIKKNDVGIGLYFKLKWNKFKEVWKK